MTLMDAYPQLYDIVASRYSCRSYTPAPLPSARCHACS